MAVSAIDILFLNCPSTPSPTQVTGCFSTHILFDKKPIAENCVSGPNFRRVDFV